MSLEGCVFVEGFDVTYCGRSKQRARAERRRGRDTLVCVTRKKELEYSSFLDNTPSRCVPLLSAHSLLRAKSNRMKIELLSFVCVCVCLGGGVKGSFKFWAKLVVDDYALCTQART